jgi:hypothetical protein
VDPAEQRLQAVVDDADNQIRDLERELAQGLPGRVAEGVRRRLDAARRRRRSAQGALDRYRADKKRREN